MVIVWHYKVFSSASHLTWPRLDEYLMCMTFYTKLNPDKIKYLPPSLSPTGPRGLIIFVKELLGIAIM